MSAFLRILFVLLLISSQVSAGTVYVIPHDNPTAHTPKLVAWNRELPHWKLLEHELQKLGYGVKVVSLFDLVHMKKEVGSNDAILFIDPPCSQKSNWQELIKELPQQNLFLFTSETTPARPLLYTTDAYSRFETVFTQDDTLIDQTKFIKYCGPHLRKIKKNLPSFYTRNLLTLITNNEPSNLPFELATEQLQLIQFFEKIGTDNFHLYGHGWSKSGFRSLQGTADSKTETLKNYRFAIVYENRRKTRGQITEKIFNCFAAGSIPIYWGASNITQYIPKSCFIDRQDFRSTKSLYNFLRKMKKSEYDTYLRHARQFLKSEEAKKFAPKVFVETILGQLQKKLPPVVHVLGDSHSKFSFSTIKGCQIHWLGPHTMHRTGRDGLQGLDIRTYKVRENDTAIFVFGEIDVRCHVIPQCEMGRSLDQVIDTLVSKYIATICENRKQYKNLHTIVFAVVPPIETVYNPTYPTRGSLADRIAATRKLNQRLTIAALREGIDVIDVYYDYCTKEGYLNPDLSDGGAHINPDLNEPVRAKLTALLKKYAEEKPK